MQTPETLHPGMSLLLTDASGTYGLNTKVPMWLKWMVLLWHGKLPFRYSSPGHLAGWSHQENILSCPPLPSSSLLSFSCIPFLGDGWASQMAQWWRICLPMQKTWVRSLVQEDLLEKKTATHSSILALEIPWREEPGGLQSTGFCKVGHNLASEQITGNGYEQREIETGRKGETQSCVTWRGQCLALTWPSGLLCLLRMVALASWNAMEKHWFTQEAFAY